MASWTEAACPGNPDRRCQRRQALIAALDGLTRDDDDLKVTNLAHVRLYIVTVTKCDRMSDFGPVAILVVSLAMLPESGVLPEPEAVGQAGDAGSGLRVQGMMDLPLKQPPPVGL